MLLEVKRWGKRLTESVASFAEELVVRRELADNFCFYNDNYDNLNGQYTLLKDCVSSHKRSAIVKEAGPLCLNERGVAYSPQTLGRETWPMYLIGHCEEPGGAII